MASPCAAGPVGIIHDLQTSGGETYSEELPLRWSIWCDLYEEWVDEWLWMSMSVDKRFCFVCEVIRAGDEVGFDFSNANLNPVWAMTAYHMTQD